MLYETVLKSETRTLKVTLPEEVWNQLDALKAEVEASGKRWGMEKSIARHLLKELAKGRKRQSSESEKSVEPI